MWYRLTSQNFSISHWTTHIGRPLLDKSVFLTPRLFHKTLWSSVCGCCTNTDPTSLLFKRGFRYQSLWQRIFFDADTLFQPAFPYIQYRCEWIPDCNTLDPYLCLANMAELDTPSPPGKQRYPGLEGMRRYHSLSSEIWRKRKGGVLSEAYATIYSRFSCKVGSHVVSDGWPRYCADIRSRLARRRHGSESIPGVHLWE